MGYYTRVLTTKTNCIPVPILQAAISQKGYAGAIEIDPDESPNEWTQIVLRHLDGPPIAAIERNPVAADSLGAAEIQEFIDTISDPNSQPRSAADWLQTFLPKVRCIYAFQHLSGTEHGAGFEILNVVRNAIWSSGPAIFQADQEGFSNEAGYHILWQFSDSAKGKWCMGVLKKGTWIHFEMDLGNKSHREAFLQGEVPQGVRLAG